MVAVDEKRERIVGQKPKVRGRVTKLNKRVVRGGDRLRGLGEERSDNRFEDVALDAGREGVIGEGGVELGTTTAAGTGEGAGTRLERSRQRVVQPSSSLIRTLTLVGVKFSSLQVEKRWYRPLVIERSVPGGVEEEREREEEGMKGKREQEKRGRSNECEKRSVINGTSKVRSNG